MDKQPTPEQVEVYLKARAFGCVASLRELQGAKQCIDSKLKFEKWCEGCQATAVFAFVKFSNIKIAS